MIPQRPRTTLLVVVGAFVLLSLAGIFVLGNRVHALRSQRATGPNWSFPSRVYSDRVVLERGRALPEAYLVAQLRARDYRQVATDPPPGTFRRVPGGLEIGLRGLPDEPPPIGGSGPERVRVILAGSRVVSVERLGGYEGALQPDPNLAPVIEPVLVSLLFDPDRVWRTWTSIERVPRPVQDAILASEDRRFYGHFGFDPRGTLRALMTNVRTGEIREGGSTVTQQLARSLFLGRERTLLRKVTEIPMAMGLEALLSKQDILEMYLNSIYWGQAEGFAVGGVVEAAHWYFDTPVESLDVLQGATLAAMIPAPNQVNPFENAALTLKRRNQVLNDMAETGKLSRAEAAVWSARPLGVRRGRPPIERFPSYTGFVASVLDKRLSAHAATHYGLVVLTSMDLAWQAAAENQLRAGLAGLDVGGARRLQGGFVALDPRTSGIVAMVGGRAPRPGDFNRAWQAQRQAGSAIKPVVYAAAFSGSYSLTPATTMPDTLTTFGKGRWAWTPRNYDHSTHVEVTLAKALEKSLNIATAHLVELIGPGEVSRTAEKFGLGRLRPVASIGLGTTEISLLQLTNAYAVFQSGGMFRTPAAVLWVGDRQGREVMKADERAEQVISPGTAALMTGLLQNVVHYGVAYPLQTTYGFQRPVAGKTGTTDDYKDAWFIGFTPDVVAGVWVGYDRPSSIGRQAAHTALPVWARVVGRMLEGFPATEFEVNQQLEWVNIDPWIGVLSDSICPAERVPFLPGTAPFTSCSEAMLYGYEYERLDSLYAPDTSWRSPVPDSLADDTLEVVPEIDPYEFPGPDTGFAPSDSGGLIGPRRPESPRGARRRN